MVYPKDQSLVHYSFCLYNDLPNISDVLNFYLFADDTNIYYEPYSLQELEKTINKELNKPYSCWMSTVYSILIKQTI